MKLNKTKSFNLFDFINYSFLILFSLTIIYPFVYLLSLSLSSREGLLKSESILLFLPKGFSWQAYARFLQQPYIYTGYYQTIMRTVVGTFLSVLLMSLAAYSISKKDLPLRRLVTFLFIFTMFFSGGLIPTYLLVKSLGLIDNPLVFILAPPFLFNTFYMLILRNFFLSIPKSLEESAKIDGASDLRIFFTIIVPLAISAIATVALWVAVNHWNSWFDSILYMQKMEHHVIQVHIRRLVIEQSAGMVSSTMDFYNKEGLPTPESMRAAAIIITVIPVLCIYPFIQKYFVKGVIVGAIKA